MNVVDSCGWLEYFGGGPNAQFFSEPLEAMTELIVPLLSIYEVFKRIVQQKGESAALQAAVSMQQGRVIDLTPSLAMTAARLSLDLRLPMADSIMLATARTFGAELWTQDADFADIPDVRYRAKGNEETSG